MSPTITIATYNYIAANTEHFSPGVIFLEFSTISASPPRWRAQSGISKLAKQTGTGSVKGLIRGACVSSKWTISWVDRVSTGSSPRPREPRRFRFCATPRLDERLDRREVARFFLFLFFLFFPRGKLFLYYPPAKMSADGRRSRMTSEFNLRASGSRGVLKRHRPLQSGHVISVGSINCTHDTLYTCVCVCVHVCVCARARVYKKERIGFIT